VYWHPDLEFDVAYF